MNPRIQHLIYNPFEVQLSDVALLQDEIEKYPYFSTLRTLLLFGLKEFDHSSYQEELKKTSIHCPSRVALYHYLQREKQESTEEISSEIIEVETAQEIEVEEKIEIETNPTEPIEIQEEIATTTEEETISEDASTGSESILTDVSHSELTFSEWLSLSKSSSEKKENPPSEKDIKFQLIEEFIEKSPKISPVNKNMEVHLPTKKTEASNEYSDLMTETLAQIYTEQKKYDKAIRAYKILSLKYPEKCEFFADKISEIEYLMDSK